MSPKKPLPATPPDLARALAANGQAKNRFDALPPSHQREYIAWISEAKRSETRARRITQAVQRIAKDVAPRA